jgi:predicted nucleic acid-binding protein
MILVDTSVWIDHFRTADATLIALLEEGIAATHPFVIGELAAGNLKSRAQTLAYFRALPLSPLAGETEVLHFLESHRLWGLGLGWVDLHLLTSATIAGWKLLTTDRALKAAGQRLKLQ